MSGPVQVASGQVRDGRADLERVILALDELAGDVLRVRLMFATALLLRDFEDAGVDPASEELGAMVQRLRALYDGLDFSLIEEWL